MGKRLNSKQKNNDGGANNGVNNGVNNDANESTASAVRVFGPQDRRRVPRRRESTPDAEALSLSRALPRR